MHFVSIDTIPRQNWLLLNALEKCDVSCDAGHYVIESFGEYIHGSCTILEYEPTDWLSICINKLFVPHLGS